MLETRTTFAAAPAHDIGERARLTAPRPSRQFELYSEKCAQLTETVLTIPQLIVVAALWPWRRRARLLCRRAFAVRCWRRWWRLQGCGVRSECGCTTPAAQNAARTAAPGRGTPVCCLRPASRYPDTRFWPVQRAGAAQTRGARAGLLPSAHLAPTIPAPIAPVTARYSHTSSSKLTYRFASPDGLR